ncbi:ribbon-helix-helix protein, CopG family [Serratia fonticola]|uniref:ribbon-helix-helix protein, CopG family n=1 Tax=Serratia fonticola TaxID=47917 RepID=UPI0027EA844F|nr:ribbon-helix-helix protein, CopG family [Serratia fonticola]MDQ7209775.1 ribbon-helix-helix protein, CopG family [Serratia fonticola]HBE9079145.1 ribbon-helix-helix protein, CopG family [Serratia fonticola]
MRYVADRREAERRDKRQSRDVTFNKELKARLEAKAEAEGRSVQSLIREAVALYLVSGETSNDHSTTSSK